MRDRKGFVLLTALIMTLALTIMVAGYSVTVYHRNSIYKKLMNSIRAYQLAGDGLDYGRGQVIYNNTAIPWGEWEEVKDDSGAFPPDAVTFSLSGADLVTVTFVQEGSIVIIQGSATIGGVTRSLASEIEALPGFYSNKWYNYEERAINDYRVRWSGQ